jgi:hypothetical protein
MLIHGLTTRAGFDNRGKGRVESYFSTRIYIS